MYVSVEAPKQNGTSSFTVAEIVSPAPGNDIEVGLLHMESLHSSLRAQVRTNKIHF